jgi:hypothetical protein
LLITQVRKCGANHDAQKHVVLIHAVHSVNAR